MPDVTTVSVSPTCGVPLMVGSPVAWLFSASVFSIVPVACPSAIDAPDGFLRWSVNVSPLSSTMSSLIGTWTVFKDSPGPNVSVPLVNV